MFICFILPAVDWIGLVGVLGVWGGDRVEGSAYSSVTGNGLCGQVYCAGYTLTSGRLNSARRLQDSISRVSLDNAVMLQESVFDHSVTVLNVGRVVLVAPISHFFSCQWCFKSCVFRRSKSRLLKIIQISLWTCKRFSFEPFPTEEKVPMETAQGEVHRDFYSRRLIFLATLSSATLGQWWSFSRSTTNIWTTIHFFHGRSFD